MPTFHRILSLIVFSGFFLVARRESPPGAAPELGALGAALATDPDPRVREHAAAALGALQGGEGWIPLAHALLKDPDPRVREHASEALGALGQEGARDALFLAVLADPEPRVREHAAEALGRLRP